MSPLWALILVPLGGCPLAFADDASAKKDDDLLQLFLETMKPQEVSCPSNNAACRCIRFDPERAMAFLHYVYSQWCPIDARDGLKEGHWSVTNLDKNWIKVSKGEFFDGKVHGKWVDWHANGQKATEYEWNKGVPVGDFRRWHENGTLAIEGQYVNGEADGIWVYRDKNGRITRRVHWKHGKVVSVEKLE